MTLNDNNTNSERTSYLTEEQIRAIVREEVWKILTEISEQKLKDIKRWQKFINSFTSDLQ